MFLVAGGCFVVVVMKYTRIFVDGNGRSSRMNDGRTKAMVFKDGTKLFHRRRLLLLTLISQRGWKEWYQMFGCCSSSRRLEKMDVHL
jgi:hypothetical protein